MSRCSLSVVAGLAVALAALSCASPPREDDPRLVDVERNIPEATWVDIFFEAIDERTREAGIEPVRFQRLPADALEARIWKGFGVTRLEGFILRQGTDDSWSALHIPPARQAQARPVNVNGERLFHRLTELDLLTLPDSSKLPDENVRVRDGTSYVVEIHQGETYRTYHYSNPDYQDWPEAEKMVRIGELLEQAFTAASSD